MGARDLLMRRQTNNDGSTIWVPAEAVAAATDGGLLILEGVHRCPTKILTAIVVALNCGLCYCPHRPRTGTETFDWSSIRQRAFRAFVRPTSVSQPLCGPSLLQAAGWRLIGHTRPPHHGPNDAIARRHTLGARSTPLQSPSAGGARWRMHVGWCVACASRLSCDRNSRACHLPQQERRPHRRRSLERRCLALI
mmetsp:Transcript_2532/g.7146  ORF Transcript_2532/g.7146 Transcript_2532/m.7146 type:complete len:194 (-) Transcript_2532:6380-6961(-)